FPLDKAGLVQGLAKCTQAAVSDRVRRPRIEKADHRHRRLLRPRRERPSGCGATKQRDELASFHSITASARASSGGEISRPRALAVWRLMTSSTFVASMTGRSAGLAPARIRRV